LAVWSRPEIVGGDRPPVAKLGGAGLTLVALLSIERVQPGSSSLDELRRLGEFVLWMQKPDGSFYSKFVPHAGGRSDRWTSLYYPGEAALGLVMLYEHDPTPRWLAGATAAIDHLARSRAGKKHVPADHWALIATARLMKLSDQFKEPATVERLTEHAAKICESMLDERPAFPSNSVRYGGFAADGRTCPTATRLEGLLASLEFLDDDYRDLRERIERRVSEGIEFLLRAQLTEGALAGGMPRAIRRLPNDHPLSSSHFNRRAGEVRIDYVQHGLSAMIEFGRQDIEDPATGDNSS